MKKIRINNPEFERASIPRISPAERFVARVLVDNTLCGYKVLISAQLTPQGRIKVEAETECKMVEKMVEKLPELTTTELRYVNAGSIYDLSAEARMHPNCLVQPAIIAACMIASGLISKEEAQNAPPTIIDLAPNDNGHARLKKGFSKVKATETLLGCNTLIRAKQSDETVKVRLKSNCNDVMGFGEEVPELPISSLRKANPGGMIEIAEDAGLSPISFVIPNIVSAGWIATEMVAAGLIEDIEPMSVSFMPADNELAE
ncbi:MAG: DUF6951 family protein [Methermicoccaceae archaeon]